MHRKLIAERADIIRRMKVICREWAAGNQHEDDFLAVFLGLHERLTATNDKLTNEGVDLAKLRDMDYHAANSR